MDPMVTGAALFAAGTVTGVVLDRLPRRRKRTPEVPGPRCGCGHLLSEHDAKRKSCLAQVQRRHYQRNGDWNGHEWVQCSCLTYIGPEPIMQVWIPPAVT